MEEFEICPACEAQFLWEEGYHGTPGRVECPECQCDFDAEHDVDYNTSMHNEAADFDKFMGRILQEEKRIDPATIVTDSPQRARAARHQERPLGRTRIGFAR